MIRTKTDKERVLEVAVALNNRIIFISFQIKRLGIKDQSELKELKSERKDKIEALSSANDELEKYKLLRLLEINNEETKISIYNLKETLENGIIKSIKCGKSWN